MSDNLRRYRAIRDALTPPGRAGRTARWAAAGAKARRLVWAKAAWHGGHGKRALAAPARQWPGAALQQRSGTSYPCERLVSMAL